MNEMTILDDNGNEYIVNNVNGNYETFKIVDGNKIIPTKEELQFVLEEIKKR